MTANHCISQYAKWIFTAAHDNMLTFGLHLHILILILEKPGGKF